MADFSRALMLRLDPDGAEPEDRAGERNRGVTFGRLRDGVVPFRGGLLPATAAQLQRLFDAVGNPAAADAPPVTGGGVRFVPADATDTDAGGACDADASGGDASGLPDPGDERTPAQKRHDAFAMIVTVAAASGGFPELGGAAPTLVVSVTAEDYVNGTGRARLEGTGGDVPVSVARQTACAGGVQRVLFDERGQIVSIGTTARIFTAVQRRAIVLRDRECVIPGCDVPATWCEIHHVREHAAGGPTHTSNGVALCWHHHRTLDTSGWQVRMRHGVPEIRGPHWWDPHRGWHRPRTHHRPPPHRTPAHPLAPPG
ncbi:HNH endonuclease signature motif containing protein [Microbacterium sp. 13-71-7]|uniref:HNH endonuclease signature motif containing protein n=1 Tax=Microbacterium sp. 13-71-7 TaxID=1970399 RepID=UPI0025DF0AE0|nr:HNH endonuclease signature motif containing protein [Microbacterium sp. 13-71-7]